MPSSATITTFYSFTPNTKARASQVNTNFGNFRGHLVAIDPNTATAVNNTYDLGSSEYYWRSGYFGTIDFRTSTNTANMTIAADTSATTGSMIFSAENSVGVFLFKNGGVTRARIDENGLDGNYLKTNSVTIGSLFTRGTAQTSTGSGGALVMSATFTVTNVGLSSNTSSTYHISGSTVTLTSIGRPVVIGVIAKYYGTNTIPALPISGQVNIVKDGTTIYSGQFSTADVVTFPLNIMTINFATAGAHNYSASLTFDITTAVYSLNAAQVYAYEL